MSEFDDYIDTTSSFSYEKSWDASLRLVVEQSSKDETMIDMIVNEGCSIWHAAFKKEDLPTVTGQPGLEAEHFFEYLRDGKGLKHGCSLELSKVGDSVILNIEEKRGGGRPPTVMRFQMAECKKEDKELLLERVFVSMKKEIFALKVLCFMKESGMEMK